MHVFATAGCLCLYAFTFVSLYCTASEVRDGLCVSIKAQTVIFVQVKLKPHGLTMIIILNQKQSKVMVDKVISSSTIKQFNPMLHCFLLLVNLLHLFLLDHK